MKFSDILDSTGSSRARPPKRYLTEREDPWGRFSAPDDAAQASASHAATAPAEKQRQEKETQAPGANGQPKASPFSAAASHTDSALILPPPVPRLPVGWGMEIQRIAHHLVFGLPEAPQVVLFSALVPQSGVSTVAYLLSHHLASSQSDKRTLLLSYSPSEPLTSNPAHSLYVGESFSWRQLPADQSLNTLRLYGGAEFSVAEKVRWFRSLIASARQLFGIVLIDVPPLVRCAEGYLLASESDGVVMVLKSGQVRKPAVMSLRAELQRMNIPILGGILTFRRYPLPQWLLRVL